MAAEANNKYSQIWTLENAMPRFIDSLEFAEQSEDCLCLQDAIHQTGIPYTTYYQLSRNHKDLHAIKQDTMNEIIRRINKGGLLNKMNPASAIWRMKQLGEKDESTVNQSINPISHNIEVKNAKQAGEINEALNMIDEDN